MNENPTIRVGLVGLSSRSLEDNAPGFWARAAHLPTILDSPHYTLTALCNSSQQAAKAAVEVYKLDPSHVATYGDPASLAQDDNVDVVVCCVNVEHHYDIVKPALQAGKMVICEWPLGRNAVEMAELAEIARVNGVRTAVGLQGRFSDCVQTITELVWGESKAMGRLLSTSMVVHGVMLESSVPEGLEYFVRREAGGNMLTIRTIHLLDMMTAALGEIHDCKPTASTQRKTRNIVDRQGETIRADTLCNTPDHNTLSGQISPTNAAFTYQFRTGRPFKGTPVLDWRIYGDKAEIRVTSNGTGVQMDHDVEVQLCEFATDTVTTVDTKQTAHELSRLTRLEGTARNTARLYAAFADRELYQAHVPDFGQALKWSALVEEVYRALDAGDGERS